MQNGKRSALVVAGALSLAMPALGAFALPTGIYSLSMAADNPNTPTDERLANIRNFDFVSGYTLRVFWKDIESAQGVYNFGVIDEAVRRTKAIGQHLNLEVLGTPEHVVAGAGATYVDHRGGTSPVPWDSFAQTRYAALQNALASHVVVDGTGPSLPLSQHPTLLSVDASSVGLNFGVRDLNNGIRSHPDYTQQRYINSVLQGVAASRAAFPNQQGFLAFFGFNDGQPGTPVDRQLLALLDGQYNNSGQPTLALFAENLSDLGPVPIGVSGGTGNNLVEWVGRGGETMMQALDSWVAHAPDRDAQLLTRNPATGIALAYNNYGTRFVELYVSDLDAAVNGELDASGRSILTDLRTWNSTLTAVPEPMAGSMLAFGLPMLGRGKRRSRR